MTLYLFPLAFTTYFSQFGIKLLELNNRILSIGEIYIQEVLENDIKINNFYCNVSHNLTFFSKIMVITDLITFFIHSAFIYFLVRFDNITVFFSL